MFTSQFYQWIDHPGRVDKEAVALNEALDQTNLADLYRKFLSKKAEWTFVSSAHGTFSTVEHILGHKTILNLRRMK